MTAPTSPSQGARIRSSTKAEKAASSGTMRVAGPWPGCQGSVTVGTDQTGCPSDSSAKTTARLPTVPRATWLEIDRMAGLSPPAGDAGEVIGSDQVDDSW